jgi:hypothetical protein
LFGFSLLDKNKKTFLVRLLFWRLEREKSYYFAGGVFIEQSFVSTPRVVLMLCSLKT